MTVERGESNNEDGEMEMGPCPWGKCCRAWERTEHDLVGCFFMLSSPPLSLYLSIHTSLSSYTYIVWDYYNNVGLSVKVEGMYTTLITPKKKKKQKTQVLLYQI